MYKHLLIPTDGSDVSMKGVEQGLALAKALGARATIVTVSEPWVTIATGEMGLAFPPDDYARSAAANADDTLAKARKLAEAAGVACDTLYIKEQYPAEAIVAAAADSNCDLIVMASHGRRGIGRLLLGSQAHRVVTESKIAVLICR